MPKRLVTLLYFFGLLLVTLLIVVAKPAQSGVWSSTLEFPVARCDGYEVWTRADTTWRRDQFYDREEKTMRVTRLLDDWEATYYNREAPDRQIHYRATGIGENLELTLWMMDGQVVRTAEKGNPFRLVIPDIGALVLKAVRQDSPDWNRFDVTAEGATRAALCEALAT